MRGSRGTWRKYNSSGLRYQAGPPPQYAEPETIELSLQRTSERIKALAGTLDQHGAKTALRREHELSKALQLALLRAQKIKAGK